jgi:hypothetical protein
MSLKKKQIIAQQKAEFEAQLAKRLVYLAGKGIEGKKALKDTISRKLKADIKAMNGRLKFFTDNEKITEDMAKVKAERLAAPKEKGPAKEEKAEKAAKGEKPKKGGEEGKEKKPKGEKKPAAPKAKEAE